MLSGQSAWLARLCEEIDGVEQAAFFEASGQAASAVWPDPDEAETGLGEVAAAAFASRQAASHPGPKPEAGDPSAHSTPRWEVSLGIPLALGGRRQAVVALGLHAEASHAAARAAVDDAARWLPLILAAQKKEAGSADAFTMGLITTVLEQDDPRAVAIALTSKLAALFACERVSLGYVHHDEIELEAISHSARFDARSRLARALAGVMQEAVDAEAPLRWPAGDDGKPAPAHKDFCANHGMGCVFSVPLSAEREAIGAITVEYKSVHPAAPVITKQLARAATVLGPVLALTRSQFQSPWRRIAAGARDALERWVGPERAGTRLALGAALLLLTWSAFWPVTYRVAAPAYLEGTVQRAVVAPIEGYIAESRARAGDMVQKGQVLGIIDDTELALERDKWGARKAQLEKELRSALAEGDRSEMRIIRARLAEASAEFDLAHEQLARTRLIAPFSGVVVVGDLSRSLGSPVERGEVLFEIAPLDRYRIVLEVPESDVATVKPGQAGSLTLAAHPGEQLPLQVERITPVAVSEDERNFFRVEAVLNDPRPSLRPGMEGVAKIDVGLRSLLWTSTHSLVDWLRLTLWARLP